MIVEFVWIDETARRNLRKHGIDFADAVTALCDELALQRLVSGASTKVEP